VCDSPPTAKPREQQSRAGGGSPFHSEKFNRANSP
jgi:hypothetical protein